VYFVIVDECVVYVGQTSNLRARLKQHRSKLLSKYTTWVVKWQPEPDESRRLQLETCYIMVYLPNQNKAVNIGIANPRVWQIRWKRKSRASGSGNPKARNSRKKSRR
jgi:hypothetical protein